MIAHKRLYLIGMPASGKSTWGRQLALAWNWRFLDLDVAIEARTGMRIPEIFAAHGEAYFREREREALHATKQHQQTIIATGGGTPCFFDNLEFINREGVSVFLEVPLDSLLQRLRRRGNHRPLFSEQDQEKLRRQLHEKYRLRLPYYEQAHLRIAAESFPLLRLADKIQLWEYDQLRSKK